MTHFGLHTPESVGPCSADTRELLPAERTFVNMDQIAYRIVLTMCCCSVYRHCAFGPRKLAYVSVGFNNPTYFVLTMPVRCHVPSFRNLMCLYRLVVHDPVSAPPFVP